MERIIQLQRIRLYGLSCWLWPSDIVTDIKKAKLMVVGFCTVVVTVAFSITALDIWYKRQEYIAAQIKSNKNLSKSFQEQINRLIATLDKATFRLRDEVINGQLSKNDYVRFANETGLVPDILTQLTFANGAGFYVGGNHDPYRVKNGPIDLSQRDYIKPHLDPSTAAAVVGQFSKDGLFIGKPVLGEVSKKWTIQLSRGIDDKGKKLGVVVASLNTNYIEQIFSKVDLGSEGTVSLIGDDRVVRTQVLGQKATQIDYVLPTNSLFAETLSPTGSSYLEAEGSYLRVSGLDDKERIISYHRVGDYPLMVFVSTTTDETLAGWRSSSFVAVILCGAFSIVLFFLSMVLLFSLRRLDEKNAALQRSEREAISASMAKSTFLAAISHELRTPLTSIRGYAELLELKVENPSQKEQAGLIRRGSEHLNALLSEILDFAKAETGAMTVTLETFNVRQLVRSCTDLFGVTAASKNLAFNVHIDEAVPESIVCDGLRLRQILNNLLSNALKFTQSGTVGVEVSVQDEKLSFMVADTGPGIPDDKFDLVFEKFMHANDRVSNEHGGTGLGLALSKALAELMSGTVKLQSKVGEGSKFTVLIPLKTEIEPAALPVAPPSAS